MTDNLYNVTDSVINIGSKISIKLPWVCEHTPDVDAIPKGDVPGEIVVIGPDNLRKSQLIFPTILELLIPVLKATPFNRAVIAFCGGSGVGKSGISALISYYLNCLNIGSYTLSGDNYPHRIPKYNDAERLRIFRQSGLRGLISSGQYTLERYSILKELQEKGEDSNSIHAESHPWLSIYQNAGYDGLRNYIGTMNEINFSELNEIIAQFKNGQNEIYLRRMGRTETELYYESVDFSAINVMVIDWTHGNSHNLLGVDMPILLHSTPEETLEQRKARNRDKGVDSPFTKLVLELEQDILLSQAPHAKLIVSQNGEIITFHDLVKRSLQEDEGDSGEYKR